MATTIYHNPRCSKSRQTLALLQQRGIEPVIIEYLKTPPNTAELADILAKLGREPLELMRQGEAEFKAHVKDKGLSRGALIASMVEHPILIERPIVLHGDKAALGRPPESVLEVLGDTEK
ncbi:MAG: arsenate reductase (glutaredoxin) [Mariprofundaceae bacterium]